MYASHRPIFASWLGTRAWLLLLSLLLACSGGSTEDTGDEATAGERAKQKQAAEIPKPKPLGGVTQRTEVPSAARALSDSFAATAAAIRPSVVRLDVEIDPLRVGPGDVTGMPLGSDLDRPNSFRRFFGLSAGGPGEGAAGVLRVTGSGFILDQPAGYVLTNSHVIRGAASVTIVTSDGKTYPAEVVGEDELTDVGVVRFQKTPPRLTSARLGKSSEVQVGQWVLAVGSPLGIEQTVTAGIVSGLGKTGGRMRLSGERVRRFIQTDALINLGNTGGPLLNLEGEVIGVNTLVDLGPGGSYGFAIPIDQAKQVAWLVAKEGRVRYPYIGVLVGDVEELAAPLGGELPDGYPERGAYVAEVTPGAPAARAGLQAGDVITDFAGEAVVSASDLLDQISARRIGDSADLAYVREGAARKTQVEIAELPSGEGESEKNRFGLTLQTLTETMARSLGLRAGTRGTVIAEVREGSSAEAAGLEPGDVIVQIDRQDVRSDEEASELLKADTGRPRLLRVVGPNGTRFVTLELE